MTQSDESLAAALGAFDRAEANLGKLDEVWDSYESLLPEDIEFGGSSAEVAELIDEFDVLACHLPAIDGFTISARLTPLDEISETRLGYWEIGEPLGRIKYDDSVMEPGRQLAVYRRRLERARRQLVRDPALQAVEAIDALLRDVVPEGGYAEWPGRSMWDELRLAVSQLQRLVGGITPGRARWGELRRHLSFGEPNDLSDIVSIDWPSVRKEVEGAIFAGRDPLPVPVDDLGELVKSRPTGPVSSRIDWSELDAERFEGLVFEIIRHADGYENANWLMATNAADRGRDIEVYRVVADSVGDTRRYRVVVQCKHWLSRSVGRRELIECVESVRLWEPPKVDVLVVASSGRFSQDAVAVAEQRQQDRAVPSIELWPDNRLELLVSRRPHIAPLFDLRRL